MSEERVKPCGGEAEIRFIRHNRARSQCRVNVHLRGCGSEAPLGQKGGRSGAKQVGGALAGPKLWGSVTALRNSAV